VELLRRLSERNQREDANALTVTPKALDDFFARFDPPAGEEEVIVYTGELDTLVWRRVKGAAAPSRAPLVLRRRLPGLTGGGHPGRLHQ
jgi:hypothetical protein